MRLSLSRALAGALVAISGVQALPQIASDTTSQPPSSSSSAAASSSSSPSSSSSSSTSVCNNSPTLCGRRYSDITFMGAHDSSFLRDESTNFSLAGNQFKNATLALDAGVRLLQAQVHQQNSTLRLCHTSCSLLDAGPLETWLAAINYWMTQNPSDVVTILLVNSDSVDVSQFDAAFTASGLAKLGYAPTSSSSSSSQQQRQVQWPTLQSMIDGGTRLVSFVTNIKASAAAPYLLPEFDYVFETPFTVTQLTGFNCTLDRPSSAGDAASALSKGLLGLVNHFKYQTVTASILIPDVSNIDAVNSANTTADGDLGKHLAQCSSQWQRRPSFVLVDFWDRGSTMQAADALNGLTDVTGRETVNSTASGDESSAESGRSRRNLEQGALIAFLAATLLMV